MKSPPDWRGFFLRLLIGDDFDSLVGSCENTIRRVDEIYIAGVNQLAIEDGILAVRDI